MINSLLKLLAASLKRILHPSKIEKAFRALPPTEERPSDGSGGIRVCALQLEAKAYRSLDLWIRELDGTLAKAAGQGAQLVCLPELYGMIPYFLHPVIRMALWAVNKIPAADTPADGSAQTLDLYPLLSHFAFVNQAYEDILCRFAKRYRIRIFGGTGLVPDGGKVYNRGFLTSSDGQVEARQDKIHLTAEEMALGLSTGNTIRVVPTELGNIALCVCMDATYFETFQVGKALGADYIIVPIGDMAEFDAHLALRGAQMRVSETGLTAIKPALVSTPDFPILFSGKAGIYFPRYSGHESVETPSPSGADMVLRTLDLPQLRSSKSDLFLRENKEFARNYMTALDTYIAKEMRKQYG